MITTFMQNILKKLGFRPILTNELFTILLIILVTFSGFGLGVLSAQTDTEEGVVIYYDSDGNSQNTVVASKSGSKYHYPWCSGAARIQKDNKIFFANPEEAENAGYERAQNCKGLK